MCALWVSEFLIYDDACHLKKYATQSQRATQTTTAEQIASIDMAVDRLHFSGHVDLWCRKNSDPNSFKGLEDVSHNIKDTWVFP